MTAGDTPGPRPFFFRLSSGDALAGVDHPLPRFIGEMNDHGRRAGGGAVDVLADAGCRTLGEAQISRPPPSS
jgi:hypothetical protein